MRNKTHTLLMSIFVLVFAPTIVVGQIVEDIAKKAAEAAFSEAERQVIGKYYQVTAPIRGEDVNLSDSRGNVRKKNNKGKGNNKRGELPKGIAKKLERGGTLPPGHAKRYLSSDLERQLPKSPDGYERIESEGQVILRNVATGVISDIIDIVAAPNVDSRNDQKIETSNTSEAENSSEVTDKKWWQFSNE